MNSFGKNFRITIFGESHGERLGVVMDGVPAGIPLSPDHFEHDLARRRSSGSVGTTPRKESDIPEIVSGVFEGYTTGAPLTVLFRNENTRSDDYFRLKDHPRPSHADLTASQKYGGFNDPRGGGHFSGRVTLGLVAAGVVAKKILESKEPEIVFLSEIIEIGGSRNKKEHERIIAEAIADGDSVGGIIECCALNIPAGWGEPFFDSIESVVAHLMFSIPGVKGVEFGSGFKGSALRGSQNNDPIIDECGATKTNYSGGVNGGIANGMPIMVQIAVKPTASIAREQNTYNFKTGKTESLKIGGRHDACIALRAVVVAESALAIALADLMTRS